ncbi:MAG TPA: hypothetical protein VJT67_00425, partial [Longimicrobiaceae bacterium]|nr:hypothetical protein [Longimicrobiaceae bacterium]
MSKLKERVSGGAAWALQYDLAVAPEALGKGTPARRLALGLVLGWDVATLDRREPAAGTDWRMSLEHRSGRRRVVDRAAKRMTECDIGRDGLRQMLARLPLAAVRGGARARAIRVGEVQHWCEPVCFDAGDLIVQAWATRLEGVAPAAAALAWAVLTAHRVPPQALGLGVPLEVVVHHRGDLSHPATHARVTSATRAPDAFDPGAAGFEVVRGQHAQVPPRAHGRRTGKEEHGPRPGTRLRSGPGAAQGPDFAWMPHQALLDRARDLVNKVTRFFGTFTGVHGIGGPGLHLDPVDWWGIFTGGLTLAGQGAISGLLGLWVLRRMTAEEPIGAMTPAQAETYRMLLDEAHQRPEEERTQYIALNAINRFDGEELIALGTAESAAFRAPAGFAPADADGNPLTSVSGELEAPPMGFKADQLDLTVRMGNRGNLDRLELRDGKLSVGVNVAGITVDCRFLTWSTASSAGDADDGNDALAPFNNALHAIADAGVAFALFNAGYARLTITNPMLNFDIAVAVPDASDPDPPAIGVQVTYDAHASSLPATLDLFGFNLPVDVAAGVGTRLTSALGNAIGA